MRNENVYKMMGEITDFIPQVFQNEFLLRKHLSFMRYFSDVEWFNLLSILYQSPNATNARTTASWEKMFNKELYPKRGERGIQIFIPLFENNSLNWKVVKVFDISQMQTTIKPQYASYLQIIINSIGNKILSQGEDGWQNQLILNTMKNLRLFKCMKKAELKFAMNCVIATCGDLLNIPLDEVSILSLKCPEIDNSVNLYKFIKDVIAHLPEQLLNYVSVMEAREKLKKEIAEATYISQMNIKQNIRFAQKVHNDRLQVITDGGDSINHNDLGDGIPLNEIVSDDDIFKGDV